MLYILTVIVAVIEYRMKFNYKNIMLFLVFGNCFLGFYLCSFSEYKLFSSPERFNNLSIIIVLIYFAFELALTFYILNKLYDDHD
ncbi:hypothetical protein GCM10022423_46940 [Flavobacterium ginsengiterrae]|uniref:Lycopene cyclase domain-containing protein n=1 Tax=Flavobacterium ginsengiterrae TaxID=871695 RepID=A0ABP7H7J6_9FLAO